MGLVNGQNRNAYLIMLDFVHSEMMLCFPFRKFILVKFPKVANHHKFVPFSFCCPEFRIHSILTN